MLAGNGKNFRLVKASCCLKNIDIFYISEAFVDLSADSIYDGLNINGYTLVRSDHPSNTTRVGVPIYYKYLLPVVRRNNIQFLE